MIAPRPQSRRRVSPACTWLIRAFAPGCPTLLRRQACWRVDGGYQLAIVFDLPDDQARDRARELVGSAAALRLVAIGRTAIREISAAIHADHQTLTVDALLAPDAGIQVRKGGSDG